MVTALAVSGKYLVAGTYQGGVFLSPDNGTSWTQVNTGLGNMTVTALAFSGTRLLAGCPNDGGIYLTTEYGTNWTLVTAGLTTFGCDVHTFVVSGMNIFVGTYGGVFLSSNTGASWTAVNDGLTKTNVFALVASGTNLFAGTEVGGVFNRPLSEMITGMRTATTETPKMFRLEQNYPNPFNPSTVICYGLPHRSHLILTVYNTLGQQVSILVEGDQEPGYHEVKFNASGLASGMYFYRLQSGNFVQTRKLLLLR